jgi:hypothetical protein
MAYIVVNQPAEALIMMRSPILSLVQETTSATWEDPTYRFSVRVKAWDGSIASPPTDPIIELLRVPDADGKAVFNIAPVLEDLFTPEQPLPVSGTTSTAGVWNCQLIFGSYLDGVYSAAETGNTFQISDGYAIQQQNINEYANFADITDGKKFLFPVESTYVIEGQSAWIHFYLAQEPDRFLDYQDDQANTFTVNFPTGTVTTSSQSIYRAPMGAEQVAALAAAVPVAWNPSRWFEIRLRDSSAGFYQSVRVFIHQPHFCDIGTDSIAYINRFGVRDYLHVRGNVTQSVSQERTTWDRRILTTEFGLGYPTGASQEGNTGIIGRKSFRVNTGFVPANTSEKVQDLLMSKTHYLVSAAQNVRIDTSSIELQKSTQEDLINYVFEFSLAGNLIQNIE